MDENPQMTKVKLGGAWCGCGAVFVVGVILLGSSNLAGLGFMAVSLWGAFTCWDEYKRFG